MIPAVLLYDVGWKTVPEELQLRAFGPGRNDLEINRIHSVEGAKIARELLQQSGYDPAHVDQIAEIILRHDSRQEAIRIDLRRFRVDSVAHVGWLGRQIDGWFLTATGKDMAQAEHKLRRMALSMP